MDKDQESSQNFVHNSLRSFLQQQGNTPMKEETANETGNTQDSKTEIPRGVNFEILPLELEKHLNTYVVDQEDAVGVIATKIATHYNRMKLLIEREKEEPLGGIKSNIIIIGPTGVGKTFIIKLIANYIGVPFVKADATKFSETGYVGGDVEDLVRDLLQEAKGDFQKAQFGVVYLDEIDKIASSTNRGNGGPDVSHRGVQRNLLKLMEESEVSVRASHDVASQMEVIMNMQRTGKVERRKINTKHILFIVSGAFDGLSDIIKKRQGRSGIGFGKASKTAIEDKKSEDTRITKNDSSENLLDDCQTEDLIRYGFESEFVGRLPIVSILKPLSKKSLEKILKNKHCSIVLSKKLDFKSYGIDLTFDNSALEYFAEKATKETIGARGLTRIMENSLMVFEKMLPSSSISSIHITKEIIQNPHDTIRMMISQATLGDFIKQFKKYYDIKLSFTSESEKIINQMARDQNKGEDEMCRDLFKNYEYGLRLIGKNELTIIKEMIQDPDGYLNSLIREDYAKRSQSSS